MPPTSSTVANWPEGWRASMTLAITSSRLMLWVFIWSGICFSTIGVST